MNFPHKWITANTVSMYFRIVGEDRKKLRNKLKHTAYMKNSKSKCGNKSGFYYYYDMEYLINILKLKPVRPIPKHLIKK